jgi:Mn2+/Fe2+ NRAMP family transporter
MSHTGLNLMGMKKSLFNNTRSFLVYISSGAMLILIFCLKDMKSLVDFATTMSFVIAPIYAYFNLKLMSLPGIPKEHRPSKAFTILSNIFILLMFSFSIYFIYLRFLN